ncbi:MAG: hypothetical protein Q8754_02700 [Sweet potato little leaf phytoplasma]|nr:hypothetical protein [Sweet potato little leaf phytoplasma]
MGEKIVENHGNGFGIGKNESGEEETGKKKVGRKKGERGKKN